MGFKSAQFFFNCVGSLIREVIVSNGLFCCREVESNLFSVLGAMYGATLFLGINNATTVQPVVAIERMIFYRERAAGMYAAVPYAIAQVLRCLALSVLFFSCNCTHSPTILSPQTLKCVIEWINSNFCIFCLYNPK
jgi:hypothetical protein